MISLLATIGTVYLIGDTIVGNRIKPEAWGIEEYGGGYVVCHTLRILGIPFKLYLMTTTNPLGTDRHYMLDHGRVHNALVFSTYTEAYKHTSHYLRKSDYNFLLEESKDLDIPESERNQLLSIYNNIKDY